MPTTSRLRDDCGGDRFLDLRGLMVLSPFAVVTGVLSSAPADLEAAWRWTVVNLIALLVTALPVLAVRHLTTSGRTGSLPLPITVVVGAAIGATKGAATSWCALAFGLIDDVGRDLIGRLANTAVLGAVVVPATAAVMAAHDRWRREHDLLVLELVRRTMTATDRPVTPYRRQLDDMLARSRSRLPDLDRTAAATELRRLVDQDLRPLSAQVLSTAAPTRSPSQGWDLLRVGLVNEPWANAPVITIYGITTWLLLDRHTTAADAAVLTMALVGVLWCLLVTAGRVRRRRPRWSIGLLLAVLVMIAVVQRPMAQWTVGIIDSLDHRGVAIVSSLWLGQLMVAAATITAARHERDVIRAQLLNLLGPQGVRDAIGHGVRAIDGRDFAVFVHGHLQNQLIAAAERLETVRDPQAIEATRQSVIDLLDRPGQSDPVEAPLETRLHTVIDRWHGLADVALHIQTDPAVWTHSDLERIVHVVAEAVTNAVRHGAAHHIDLRIAADHEFTTLIVDDDGFGPRRGRPGTGSRYLDLIAPDRWALTPAPQGGARLTVRFPHAAT